MEHHDLLPWDLDSLQRLSLFIGKLVVGRMPETLGPLAAWRERLDTAGYLDPHELLAFVGKMESSASAFQRRSRRGRP